MKHKVVYAAGVNLAGLWGPFKMSYKKGLNEYYDRSGNFSIQKIGEQSSYGSIITFTSSKRKEAVLWAKGVRASMTLLANWCSQE